MAFKRFSVASDPHGALTNRANDSSSPYSWYGAYCSLDGRVAALNLNYAGLIGGLHLPNLTAFSVTDLSVATAIPCNLQPYTSNRTSKPNPPIKPLNQTFKLDPRTELIN